MPLTGEPLLQLPPVELPPPAATAAGARQQSLAGRALLSVALLLGVLVVAVGLVVVLVGLNVGLARLGRANVGLILLTLAVVAALGKAILAMVRKPPEPTDEVEVSPDAEPELHAEVTRIAAIAGTKPPDRIAVIADVNAYVRELGPLLGMVTGKRTLAIGVPLLDALDVSELRAVLAHEMGHFAGGDTRLGPLAYRTDAALRQLVESLSGSWVSSIFFAYWKFQHRLGARVVRGQELVADRAAVAAAGRQAAADALHAVGVAAVLDSAYKALYLGPLAETGHRPRDLSSGWRALLAEPGRVAQAVEILDEDEPDDPYASHPPTKERIRRVAALPETAAVERDERAARVLVREPDRWRAAAYERWLHDATDGARFEIVEWDQWPDLVVAEGQRERAAAVDRALASLGLPSGAEGVKAAHASGRDRELAAALVAAGWRTGEPDERETVLHAASAVAVVQDAVARGARWQLSWAGPVELIDASGAEVDIDALAEALARGELPDVGAPAAAPAAAGVASERPSLPAAPAPPFERVGDGGDGGDGWRWGITLPWRAVGGTRRLVVGDDALAIQDVAIRYDDVDRVSITTAAANGQYGLKAKIVARDGTSAQLVANAVAGRDKADAIRATAAYLWDLMGAMVSPRVVASVAAEIEVGRSAEVAGVLFSREGVAPAKKPDRVMPWSEVPDPAWVEESSIRIGFATGRPIKVAAKADNAFAVFDLVPYLRALYG